MMSVSDIMQLVALSALFFFPLGFLTRHYARQISTWIRILFIKPRYIKPDRILRRASGKADPRHD